MTFSLQKVLPHGEIEVKLLYNARHVYQKLLMDYEGIHTYCLQNQPKMEFSLA